MSNCEFNLNIIVIEGYAIDHNGQDFYHPFICNFIFLTCILHSHCYSSKIITRPEKRWKVLIFLIVRHQIEGVQVCLGACGNSPVIYMCSQSFEGRKI